MHLEHHLVGGYVRYISPHIIIIIIIIIILFDKMMSSCTLWQIILQLCIRQGSCFSQGRPQDISLMWHGMLCRFYEEKLKKEEVFSQWAIKFPDGVV